MILLYVQEKIKRLCTVIMLEKVMMSPGFHLVKNHKSQSRTIEARLKKKTSSKQKMLGSYVHGLMYITESEDRLQNSLSQFTEIKIL